MNLCGVIFFKLLDLLNMAVLFRFWISQSRVQIPANSSNGTSAEIEYFCRSAWHSDLRQAKTINNLNHADQVTKSQRS